MRTLALLRGIPASGKSTWVKENKLEAYTLSSDHIRTLYQAPSLNVEGESILHDYESTKVWKTLYEMLETRMSHGEFVIVDATNTTKKEIMKYKTLAKKYRYRIYCVDFNDITIETAKERNASREPFKRVPENVIDRMYTRLQENIELPSGIKMIKPEDMVRPAKRLHKSKYADCSISDVFGIRFAVAPGNHRQRLSGLAQKLVRLFIHADNRTLLVIRKLIYIKDILHTGYEFRVFFCRDAPVVVFVRSKFVFFNAFRIASLLTGVSRMTLASSSSRRIVQRKWPSGTGPQASSISRASTRPSTLRLALSEFMLLLNSVTALTPPFMYFVTVFVTVARQTPLDLALCSWVRTFPCDSSRSRIIWHLQRIVFEVAFLRIMDLSFLYSFSVSLITYFLGLAIGITAVFS